MKNKTLDDYLAEVNYSEMNHYVPDEASLLIMNFIKLVEGESLENKTPPVHLKYLDKIFENPEKDVINVCHRGFAKSTLTEYLILYAATFGELPNYGSIPYMLYLTDSMDNGVKRMQDSLRGRYERSDYLQEMLPKANIVEGAWSFTNRDGIKTVIRGVGVGSSLRGTRANNSRPVLAFVDDVIDDKGAESKAVLQQIETAIYDKLIPALHPKRNKVIWSGTPFNQSDPLYRAVSTGDWDVNVYPVCDAYPFPEDEKDFRGSWSDRFDFKSQRKMYQKMLNKGKVHSYNKEYLLRVVGDEERLVTEDDLIWFNRSMVMQNKASYNFYITTDFAFTANQGSDYTVLSVWAYSTNKDWLLVDFIREKQTMDKTLPDLFRLVSEYKPISVGIEVTGQQVGFVDLINSKMAETGIWFNMLKIRPKTDKLSRFYQILPLIKSNKVMFPQELKSNPKMLECVEELKLITVNGFKSKHDDFIDTVSQLSDMKAFAPSNDTITSMEGGVVKHSYFSMPSKRRGMIYE